jgi:hypothetical protein
MGNGPYYANPSWDQQLPVSTRFIVLTNWGSAAVLDRETGLVWQRDATGNPFSNWAGAILFCQNQTIGGRFGWRLPSIEEATTLVDPSTGTLFSGAPFKIPTPQGFFYSASTDPSGTTFALILEVPPVSGESTIFSFTKSPFNSPISEWCVRGYQGTQSPQ